jgi:hypothetical protein
LRYKSSVNMSHSSYINSYMAVGHFDAKTTLDVVIGGREIVGGSERIARVYQGSTGNYLWNYNVTGTSITGFVTGNLDGDTYDDFIIKTSDTLYVVNSSSQDTMFNVILPSNTLRGFYAEDLVGMDGVPELVTNVKEVGVIAYNASGLVVWQGGAPLIYDIYSKWSECAFGDVDGDGYVDVVFTNYEYVSVLSGQTQELLWHCVMDKPIYGPIVGKFDSHTTPLDILGYSDSNIFVISGSQKPPLWLPPMEAHAASVLVFIETLQAATVVGIPFIGMFIVSIVIYGKKKRVTRT